MVFYFILFILRKPYWEFFTLMILLSVNKWQCEITQPWKNMLYVAYFTMSDLRAYPVLPKCLKIQEKTLV